MIEKFFSWNVIKSHKKLECMQKTYKNVYLEKKIVDLSEKV
jgi:hypothetical protein